jgi:hypothetical protein
MQTRLQSFYTCDNMYVQENQLNCFKIPRKYSEYTVFRSQLRLYGVTQGDEF